MSKGTSYIPGGKGANQAVAAARAGGDVTMIGRVGDDAFGYQLTDNLRQYGIDTDNIQFSNQKSSGMAVVMARFVRLSKELTRSIAGRKERSGFPFFWQRGGHRRGSTARDGDGTQQRRTSVQTHARGRAVGWRCARANG